jgi:hypothetical protein
LRGDDRLLLLDQLAERGDFVDGAGRRRTEGSGNQGEG